MSEWDEEIKDVSVEFNTNCYDKRVVKFEDGLWLCDVWNNGHYESYHKLEKRPNQIKQMQDT